jgi:NADH:ubiquinone oxidoreductase subunit 3 (subunit A)
LPDAETPRLVSRLSGNQRGRRIKLSTVESGMPLLDASHKRISIAFFLVAIDFIAFDLEAPPSLPGR